MVKGFIGFEIKEDLTQLQDAIPSIHPFISVYEFDFSQSKIDELVEHMQEFRPPLEHDHSTYNRRKKRFSKYDSLNNNFWYNKGEFTTNMYAQNTQENLGVIYPKDNSYLRDIYRPILIHFKLDSKKAYPYWILNKYQGNKKYNTFEREHNGEYFKSEVIPQVNISLDELAIFVDDEKIASKKLK